MNNHVSVVAGAELTPDTAIFAVLHAARTLEDRVEDALERAGLSIPKYSVLNELVAAAEPLSLSELASRLSCVRSNMTQLVDRLEGEQLVRRVPDATDRRAVKAAITEEGRRRHEAGAEELAKLHREFSGNVSDGDREALLRVLSALG